VKTFLVVLISISFFIHIYGGFVRFMPKFLNKLNTVRETFYRKEKKLALLLSLQ